MQVGIVGQIADGPAITAQSKRVEAACRVHIRTFLTRHIALEIGIDPTYRHGADLGFIPILVEDACGAGHPDAGAKSLVAVNAAIESHHGNLPHARA